MFSFCWEAGKKWKRWTRKGQVFRWLLNLVFGLCWVGFSVTECIYFSISKWLCLERWRTKTAYSTGQTDWWVRSKVGRVDSYEAVKKVTPKLLSAFLSPLMQPNSVCLSYPVLLFYCCLNIFDSKTSSLYPLWTHRSRKQECHRLKKNPPVSYLRPDDVLNAWVFSQDVR